MGKTGGDQINVSLDLMDHSIRVEHVAPVLLQGLWCLPMTWSISSWILAERKVRKTDGKRGKFTPHSIPTQAYMRHYEGVPGVLWTSLVVQMLKNLPAT